MSAFKLSPVQDSFSESPVPRRRWFPWIFLLALVAVTAGVLFLYGRPIYHSLKSWRARQLATQAESYGAQKRWTEAAQAAQAAYQLAPSDLKTLRILAHLQETASTAEAFKIYQRICELPGAGSDDYQNLARLAIGLKQWPVALRAVASLLQLSPNRPAALLLASEMSAAQNDLVGAITYARRAVFLEPQNNLARLTLARWMLLSSKDRPDAIHLLLNLGLSSKDATGLVSLELLSGLTDLAPADSLQVIRALKTHPLSRQPQHLLALQIQLRLQPRDRSALLDSALQEYTRTPEERLVLARWLNQQKEFNRTLRIVPMELALPNQNLFLVRVDAMAGLNQWKEIDALLGQPSLPLTDAIRSLYQARCAQELGQREEADARWDRAIAEAFRDANPNTPWYLADYALASGQRQQAWKIFDKLTQNPVTASRAYEKLIRMAEQDGATARLLNILQRMAGAFPKESAPRNDIAYLQLLLNQNTEAALQDSLKLSSEQPRMVAFRVTAALGYLRQHQPEQALAQFQAVSFYPSELLPGWQAVYAATLAQTGKQADAKTLAARITSDRLKPEELELIRPWR